MTDFSSKQTGFPGESEQADCQRPITRPLSLVWISQELIDDTGQVWSVWYGSPLSHNDILEILFNVKSWAETVLNLQER